MSVVVPSLLLALASAASGEAAPPDPAPILLRLAVLDLADKGAGPDLAANATDVVTVTLTKLGVFEVLSRADIQGMLEQEQQRQLMGCDDSGCLGEIGGALGVGLLVTGSLGKVGGSLLINLSLTDSATVQVLAREQRTVPREDQLTRELEGAVRFLVRGLLERRQGELIVNASEHGADVELDGRIVGVTPLGRQTLAGGPHTLKLVKTGFVTWARDVDVRPDEAQVVEAALVPSLEFIEAYDSTAYAWRVGAWTATGVAVAALTFGVATFLWNNDRADQYERELEAAQCRASDVDPPRSCVPFAARRAEIQDFQPWPVVGIVGGLVAAGAGLFLFLRGPEVGAYDTYRAGATGAVRFGLTPLPGGLAAGAATTF